MEVTRDNYELVFIDFFDGNLNEAEVSALQLFLAENPDLREEFDTLQHGSFSLEKDDIGVDVKASLKRGGWICEAEIENILVADLENDLSEEHSKELSLYLKDKPEFEFKKVQLAQTKLNADLSIVFPQKSALKKKGRVISLYTYFSVSAAAVFGLVLMFNNGKDNIQPAIHHAVQAKEVGYVKPNEPAGPAVHKQVKLNLVNNRTGALRTSVNKAKALENPETQQPEATAPMIVKVEDPLPVEFSGFPQHEVQKDQAVSLPNDEQMMVASAEERVITHSSIEAEAITKQSALDRLKSKISNRLISRSGIQFKVDESGKNRQVSLIAGAFEFSKTTSK